MGTSDTLRVRFMSWGYMHVAKPIIFGMDPDDAHAKMIDFCKGASKNSPLMGLLHFMLTTGKDAGLSRELMGLRFPNPFGLSAGLDKNGDLLRVLDAAGFGFGSFGSMTAESNPGNPKPWYHRLPQYSSLLIHAGLPNDGVDAITSKTDKARRPHGMIDFGSVGFTNKHFDSVDDMIEDYAYSFLRVMNSRTDVVEVNISCPNLQSGEPFIDPVNVERLFVRLDEIHASRPDYARKPVMVKMPYTGEDPMTDNSLDGLLDVLARTSVSGVSLSNLCKDRDSYDFDKSWEGKLSGIPCRTASEHAIAFTRRHYGDRFVINGIGGTFTADDAKRKLDLGADLVAAITVFMFKGPQMIASFKRGLE